MVKLLSFFAIVFFSGNLQAYTLSLQGKAFAPNAGGQEVYGIRLANDSDWEYGAFSNQYLITGDFPFSGILLSKKFPICRGICPLNANAQIGAGLSTGGPMLELLWNFTPFWVVRLDIATHIIITRNRPIVWSYPLWLGISLPLS